MLALGLTGVMCSGKTTALNYFKDCGARVLNSDQIVKDLVKKGRVCYAEIVALLGKSILTSNGELNRSLLREKVLKKPGVLKRLEKILHPRVRKQIFRTKNKLFKKKGILVIEVPLLFEAGLYKDMDVNACMFSSKEIRGKIAKKRSVLPKDLKRFSERQWSQAKKASKSDYIIENKSDLRALKKEVSHLYKDLLKQEENK